MQRYEGILSRAVRDLDGQNFSDAGVAKAFLKPHAAFVLWFNDVTQEDTLVNHAICKICEYVSSC